MRSATWRIARVKTDMLAWADDEVFRQPWIGAEDKLPGQVRAVFRADPLQMRHDMELSNRQPGAPATPGSDYLCRNTWFKPTSGANGIFYTRVPTP